MEPANRVIKAFGGAAKLASLLGVARGRVHAWTWPASRGGTDGRIPQRYHVTVLAEARSRGLAGIDAEFLVLGCPAPSTEG